eukprot:TRINITY_DN2917_c2_g1_i1.p1 TRINITY_DN2917_c2_g1~~TRINITY_DN2917_c2_g1_i1.p1  ORF type:complete len:410 (-),score=73.28 TRINITY_DN2917_c2_g1_i1:292-1521(-)
MVVGKLQLVVLVICTLCGVVSSQVEDLGVGVSQAHFAVDLVDQLCGAENCVFSPYSIFNVLAMLAMGAKGNTSEQMMRVLQGGEIQYQNNLTFHTLVGDMKNDLALGATKEGVEFSVADNVFFGNVGINAEYKQQVGDIYGIDGPQEVDFGNVAGSLEAINKFVFDATNGEITDFLTEDQVTPQTIAILVNALFFKGTWKYQFDEEKTHKANFSASRKNRFEVDMMQVQGEFRFSQARGENAPKFEILELLYDNPEFAMNILKPFTSLNDAREQIRPQDLLIEFDERLSTEPKSVVVYLPKFQMSLKTNIDQALKNLGMTEVFDVAAADLSGLAGIRSDPIYVSTAIHEAKIEVNEQGTTASASTGVGVVFENSMTSFLVDQPFMFTLVHKPTKAIILIGQVVDPRVST